MRRIKAKSDGRIEGWERNEKGGQQKRSLGKTYKRERESQGLREGLREVNYKEQRV